MSDNITDLKQRAVSVVKALPSGDAGGLDAIDAESFKHHFLTVDDGIEGLRKFIETLPPGSVKVDTVRVLQDGDHVVTHTDYGSEVGFDIFRFRDGKIVEHWNNLQEKPDTPSPSGHTMLDGSTSVIDLEKTDENKTLVEDFYEDIMINGKMDKMASYFEGDRYIQHTPTVGDGLTGMMAAQQQMAKHGITVKFDRVHKILGEGNFVLVVNEGSVSGEPTSFYDLLRIENGKIAEHWDVVETIPPKNEWKNQSGKFSI